MPLKGLAADHLLTHTRSDYDKELKQTAEWDFSIATENDGMKHAKS